MNQLKSCPFCGSNDIEVKQYYNDGWYWFVTCKNCKAEKIHQFKGVAIQEWNSRIAEDAKDKEIEQLKDFLEKILDKVYSTWECSAVIDEIEELALQALKRKQWKE